MTAKEHYDRHLADYYAWMIGDFEAAESDFRDFLKDNRISPVGTGVALDMGAGNGVQSVALAKTGFKVRAVDFNSRLLDELRKHRKDYPIEINQEDIRYVSKFSDPQPEVIVCCGDTITHLADEEEIFSFIDDCSEILGPKGKLILSFRDYRDPLKGTDRFIPIRTDENRIATCFLEYADDHIDVTDILYEKRDKGWKQKVSTYRKIRIFPQDIIDHLKYINMDIRFERPVNKMITIIAEKR